MKRYWLFAGYSGGCSGIGFDCFKGDFDTIDEIKEFLNWCDSMLDDDEKEICDKYYSDVEVWDMQEKAYSNDLEGWYPFSGVDTSMKNLFEKNKQKRG